MCRFLFQIWCTYESLHNENLKEAGGLEFPQINYSSYNTKKYRYFYGCGFGHMVGDSLIKTDINTKEMKVKGCNTVNFRVGESRLLKPTIRSLFCPLVFACKIWRQDGMYPSEPVFVPEPNSAAEDRGIILSVVLTAKQVIWSSLPI